MKRYKELSDKEKSDVFEKEWRRVMTIISDGVSIPILDKDIEKAAEIAERNKTPWFFAEILYHEIDGAKDKIDEIVRMNLNDAIFIEKWEYAINL